MPKKCNLVATEEDTKYLSLAVANRLRATRQAERMLRTLPLCCQRNTDVM